ncbi:MAG: PQQ-like beta-propeller repeat protein [Planctomycetaceae bacterium]|nr:PQQ-like beta-propeller repeat protein [Planctomycetaceae bacterium]
MSTKSGVVCASPWPLCLLLALLVGGALNETITRANDWPQILGPHRNGVSDGERLADHWAPGGPPVQWSQPVGAGNAGVAVVKSRGVLFHRIGDNETIEAFDPSTGERGWKLSYATTFAPQVGGDDGPLCVPTIQDGRVVTFGAQGVLTCCELSTGNQIWQRRTHREFDALEGYFGAGSTPLIWEDRVIVNVGGHKAGAGVVAFALEDGRTLWQVTDERASYAAPVATSLDGQSTVVCITRLKCLGLNPTDGAIRFELPFGKIGPTVNAATPVLLNGRVFLTASYGIGAVWAQVSPHAARELWRRQDVLSSQYTTPVAYEGRLYGIDGRQDGPDADFKCIDPQTGDTLWSESRFGYATLLRGGDKLLVVKTNGELQLVRPSPESFQPLSRHRFTTREVRALPALADGRLFVRDTQTLYCIDVGTDHAP